jgi:uncharacterized protein (TIGR03382 family)
MTGLIATLSGGAARAMDYVVGPGGMLALDQDLVLQKGDKFSAVGSAESRCAINGGTFGISAAEGWEGTFELQNCDVTGLGTVTKPAINVVGNGASTLLLSGNVFDLSGMISMRVGDTATIRVINNTIQETSVVAVVMGSFEQSQPAIHLDGSGNTNLKVFQGNRIFRSYAHFQSTQNWLVGGDKPGEGNVIIGQRAGISLEFCNGVRVVGNYIHIPQPLVGWNQVKALGASGDGIVVEHNVVRGGNWLLDIAAEIEIRYNLLGDSFDRPALLLESTDVREAVHHNIFIRNDPDVRPDISGVWVLHAAGKNKTEIYNNTFHGGGSCWKTTGGVVAVYPGAFLDSLRSNAFTQYPIQLGATTAAILGGGPERGESGYEPLDPPLPRLGYADYNLFYNPDAFRKDNYGLSVVGGQERVGPGFAANDQGMAIDQQVDPRFTDKIPIKFPYTDDALKGGSATVCHILQFYRQRFMPAAGSPLIDHGDPADGAGNDIGAVGAGAPNDKDLFASICAAGDIGTPDISAAAFTCPPVVKGLGPTPIMAPGFICVCDASGGPTPSGFAFAFLLVSGFLWIRRRRYGDGRRPLR